jgi:hypothetical protein
MFANLLFASLDHEVIAMKGIPPYAGYLQRQ